LPTGGFAHTFSCTSVFDFLKRTGIGYVTAEGYGQLQEITRQLADFEGFPSHANAVTDRPVPYD
jgi:histidinol dehydrogenase